MRFRFVETAKWLVVIPAIAAIVFSAGAQDTKTTSATAADSDSSAKAKAAQPEPRANASMIDNKSYVIGENEIGRASCRERV